MLLLINTDYLLERERERERVVRPIQFFTIVCTYTHNPVFRNISHGFLFYKTFLFDALRPCITSNSRFMRRSVPYFSQNGRSLILSNKTCKH